MAELAGGPVGKQGVHHSALIVRSGDGSLSWSGAFGEADPSGRPMRTTTPYFIASIDKLYTAVAVLRLHERGLVRLDAPIATYLPPELTERIHVLDGVDRSGEVTVAHLLGHTSGLPDYLEDAPKGGRPLIEELVEDGDRHWGAEESMARVRESLRPHFPPQPLGSARPRVRYSDSNYRLLIALVEAVTGEPYQQVVGELFSAAGMRDTYFAGDPAERHAHLEPPATLWGGEKPLEVPLILESLFSVYSTLDDQVRSLQALLAGTWFERAETVDLMRGGWKRFGFPTDVAALRAPSWPIEYGMGMMRFKLPRLFTLPADVPAVVGHTGSTGTWLFYCEACDVYIAGAVDQVTAGAVPFRLVPSVLREVARTR